MKPIEFEKHLYEHIELQAVGFNPVGKIEGSNLFRYHRETKYGYDLLGLVIYSHNTVKREDGIFIDYKHISKGVSFKAVNDILEQAKIEQLEQDWYNDEKYYNGEKILSHNHPNFELDFDIHPTISCNLINKDKTLNKDKLNEAIDTLKVILSKNIFPYYQLYSDIQSFNNDVLDQYKSINELSKRSFVSGKIGLKKMIVIGLCRNQDYERFILDYEERLRKGALQNKEKYLPHLNIFLRVKDVLEIVMKNKAADNM